MASDFITDCGLRVAYCHTDSPAECCGVAVRAGSRDEHPGRYGLAHFVEHTIFKGTSRRSASRIINHMEAVGGELNAYTTKEETYIYSVFPAGNLRRAVDLIADLALDSQFPDTELDKEREVVAEEIDSYLDTPSEAVFDDFEDLIFKGTSLGHNILGTAETLTGFDSSACREFVGQFYSAPNMVFFYSGPAGEAEVGRLVDRNFASIPTHEVSHNYESDRFAARQFALRRADGENHQAHTVAGALMPSLYSPERYSAALLNNILGGPGMNSRLNVELRERRGLVYSVESSLSGYTDVGLLTIYTGCNPEDRRRCARLVASQLERLATHPLSQRALDAARRQFVGQHTVASASAEQTILSAARSLLFRGEIVTTSSFIDALNTLTPQSLADTAARFFSAGSFSSLTLG